MRLIIVGGSASGAGCYGIKEEELIEGVEIGGVAKYISESNNANSNLFI